MGYKNITNDEIGRMCELWMSGTPIRQIAHVLGYSEATIDRYISTHYLGTTNEPTETIVKQSAMNDINFKAPDEPGVKVRIYPPKPKVKAGVVNYKVFQKNGSRKSDY